MLSIFDKHYKRYDYWYEKNKYTYLSELEAIKRVLPENGEGLEIGVGTGRFASALGISKGVEPSVNMAKIARKRGVDVEIGSGEDLPFDDAVFDCVTIIITLCFVNDPLKVIQEARRVLKKNGVLIIGIIDRESFLGKWYQNKESIFYKYAHLFSVNEVAEMLKVTGFDSISYVQTLFKLTEDIDSIEEPIDGFGTGGFVVIQASF